MDIELWRKKERWRRIKARALQVLKYSESQPRDEHGQWTDGGGDNSGEEGTLGGVAGGGNSVVFNGVVSARTIRETIDKAFPRK